MLPKTNTLVKKSVFSFAPGGAGFRWNYQLAAVMLQESEWTKQK